MGEQKYDAGDWLHLKALQGREACVEPVRIISMQATLLSLSPAAAKRLVEAHPGKVGPCH